MTPILFYGVPEGCSFGSIVALEWSGLPYRLCRIEMPTVVTGETFRRVNPVGETPSMRTADGRYISQSVAILHHVGSRSSESGLVPEQGEPAFDTFNEVLAFLNTGFFESFAPLWYAMEHAVEGEGKRMLTAMGHQKVHKAHADLERMLGAQEWLAGERRTAADAYFTGIARWTDFHRVLDRRAFPALHRLHTRLQADPAVRFAHAVEEGVAARTTGMFAGHVDLDAALLPKTSLPKAP
jgi:glutathione S-transferase